MKKKRNNLNFCASLIVERTNDGGGDNMNIRGPSNAGVCQLAVMHFWTRPSPIISPLGNFLLDFYIIVVVIYAKLASFIFR